MIYQNDHKNIYIYSKKVNFPKKFLGEGGRATREGETSDTFFFMFITKLRKAQAVKRSLTYMSKKINLLAFQQCKSHENWPRIEDSMNFSKILFFVFS